MVEKNIQEQAENSIYTLVKITVKAETKMVWKAPQFSFKDWEYIGELYK